ncbi:TFIIH/NER complex subunit [Ceratobasidium sp. 395]|nr:TFIIH/NER complex subunit [Ceratobasidium sp. 395]
MSKKFSWLNSAKANSGPSSRASPAPTAKTTPITINGVKDNSGKTVEFKSDDDVCPLCRSDRFLNPKLRLLVSTCYHRIFNKRPEDFEDLRAYNDYLEEVETIAFNLINDIDVAATEAKIAEHRAANAALIEFNEQREAKEAAALRDIEERERLDRQQRAEEARRAEEEEERERERSRLELINQLESSSAPAERVLAKAKAQQRHREALRNPNSSAMPSSALLRAKAAARAEAAVDVPHVPITDTWSAETQRFTLRDSYDDALSAGVRADPKGVMRAGGYMIEQAWSRALSCGVMGLDIPPLRGESSAPAHGDEDMAAA